MTPRTCIRQTAASYCADSAAARRPRRGQKGVARGVGMMMSSGGLFPPTPRVFYTKAPLVQVICQLRFPAVLRIERDAPVEFQERIRHAFPLFERVNPFMGQPLPPEFLQVLGAGAPQTGYHFLTENRKITVELTPQSISLTSNSYKFWEQFLGQLDVALAALQEVYRPSFFTRVGLRYQDLIDRDQIGLDGVPWSRLLQPAILGELAVKEIEENVQGANRALNVKLPSASGVMVLKHGFGKIPDRSGVGYVIDFDFSTEQKTEVADVQSVLSRLHDEVGRAFRWCITSELHDALGPQELDPDRLDALSAH